MHHYKLLKIYYLGSDFQLSFQNSSVSLKATFYFFHLIPSKQKTGFNYLNMLSNILGLHQACKLLDPCFSTNFISRAFTSSLARAWALNTCVICYLIISLTTCIILWVTRKNRQKEKSSQAGPLPRRPQKPGARLQSRVHYQGARFEVEKLGLESVLPLDRHFKQQLTPVWHSAGHNSLWILKCFLYLTQALLKDQKICSINGRLGK